MTEPNPIAPHQVGCFQCGLIQYVEDIDYVGQDSNNLAVFACRDRAACERRQEDHRARMESLGW